MWPGTWHIQGNPVSANRMPGNAQILLRTSRRLETACLSERLLREKMVIEQTWVTEAVKGRWFGGLRSEAQAFIESATNKVTGTVTWTMNQRPVDTVGIHAPDSLYLRDREAWETESVRTEREGYAMGSEELVLTGSDLTEPALSRPAARRASGVDALLLAVAVAWGSTYWVAKELVSQDTVLAVLGARMTLTAIALGLILVIMRKRLKKTEAAIGCLLGLLLSTVFTFETFGIAATSATNAGLIISLTIVMTPALETVVGKRRLSGLFYLAAVIAVAGVCFLATGDAAASFGFGDLLILLAAVARAVHVTGMHRLSAGRSIDSLNLTFVQMATCALVFLFMSSLWGTPIPTYAAGMDRAAALQMAYLVIVCTVFPFFIQMWAVRKTSPTRVSLLLGTEPVWAAAIGVTLAGDILGPTGIFGVVLVLSGTMWAQRLELNTPPTPPAATQKTEKIRTPTAWPKRPYPGR